ncbi:hypothetical protein CXB51_004641 [Gossypium anomalum]|uniref:Uncharacterized protein n=1 Tax=Gossypium anomalum TaxID=47600 RepID=A0A8J6DC49_9ROSI|nr:hypothetical protein CXB51_004641 [Gossypium anomalum]
MCEQQQQQQVTFMEMSKNKGDHRSRRRCMEEGRVRVDMSGMSLDSFPILSLNLATISNLDLSNNNLEVDVMMSQVLGLKELRNVNCLTEHTRVNDGQVTERAQDSQRLTLPKTIENCKSLEELNANFNQLSVLPDTMDLSSSTSRNCQSTQTSWVSCLSPSLTSHPYEFWMHALIASGHGELDQPRGSQRKPNFQCLENLPYSLGLLVSLVELDVSYNKITSLPDSIGCLKKLQKLCVEGNPVVSPPMEVFEQSLQAVKEYLCEKMKAGQSPPKKQSWVGKLVKCGTFNGNIGGRRGEREGFIMISEYRSIEGLASPRYMGLLSPLADSSRLATWGCCHLADSSRLYRVMSVCMNVMINDEPHVCIIRLKFSLTLSALLVCT